jgi:hypothetical protein
MRALFECAFAIGKLVNGRDDRHDLSIVNERGDLGE